MLISQNDTNYFEVSVTRDHEEAKPKIQVFRRKFDLGVVAIGDIDPKQAPPLKPHDPETTKQSTKLRSGLMLPICLNFANAIIHHFEGKIKKVIRAECFIGTLSVLYFLGLRIY